MNTTTKKRMDKLEGPALIARLIAADRAWDGAATEPDWGDWTDGELVAYMAGVHKLPDTAALTPAERAAIDKALAMRPA